MKSLSDYINEYIAESAPTGHWEDFCDEDTGEIVSVWRWEDTDEFFATLKEYDDKLNAVWNQIDSLNDAADEYYAEIDDKRRELKEVDNEIRDLRKKRKQLFIDMEEEIGQIDISNDKERDEKAQEYGEDINDIDDELTELNKQHVALVNQIKELEDKISKVYNANMETEKKLWARKDALENERNAALEKIRASYGPAPTK